AGAVLILGGLGFLNTWDMPIYIGLAVLAWGLGEALRRQRIDSELLVQVILLAVSLLAASVLAYLFFYLSFSSQAGGILPYIYPPTRLPQYLVMFGVQIFVVTVFLAASAAAFGNKLAGRTILRAWGAVILACSVLLILILAAAGLVLTLSNELGSTVRAALGERTLVQMMQTILGDRLANPWLFLLLTALLGLALANALLIFKRCLAYETAPTDAQSQPAPDTAPLFAFLLLFVGLALTFSVEFFYLRDVFSLRMNTVFKFYFQGWILLSCASAYGLWWLFGREPSTGEKPALAGAPRLALGGLAVLLIAAGMVYPTLSYYNRVNGFQSEPDLDGSSMQRRINPDDFAAIDWLRDNAVFENGLPPTILEAPGRPFASYVYEGRISAFTGFPTLLGWPGHEHQWRGEYTEPARRYPDIQTIFGTHNGETMLSLLHQWQVDYVIIGTTEQRFVVELCQSADFACEPTAALRKFELLLKPVFISGSTVIYQVP
ncbi:MAG: DUF2298 domain-containing protein, partial [Anaerolineales bacterium]|nr:DUF2298 domain-containing protein [Anaerolineales bacterium]